MSQAAPAEQALFDCRKAWAETIEALAEADERIVAVVNDSVGSSNLGGFQAKFPDRLINVGIAEQNLVGVSAGLANGGRIPFVSAASCFLTGRALEQLKADIAYAGFNVKLVGQSSGIAYGELGATHHSIEDFAWLRPLSQITVIVPADPHETREAVKWAAAYEGPVFIRLSRMPVPELDLADPFVPGKARRVREGDDVTHHRHWNDRSPCRAGGGSAVVRRRFRAGSGHAHAQSHRRGRPRRCGYRNRCHRHRGRSAPQGRARRRRRRIHRGNNPGAG